MANFASNTPISRPRKMPWEISYDCNGLVWSNDWGLFFDAADPLLPIVEPKRIRRT